MGNNIQIDFTMATLISNEMKSEITNVENLYTKSANYLNEIRGLNNKFFATSISNMENICKDIEKIKSKISTLQNAFDSSVENYYQAEKNVAPVKNNYIPVPSPRTNNVGEYVWGYKADAKGITKVEAGLLEELLIKKGAKKIGDNLYQVNINGTNYSYNVSSGWMTDSNKRKFKCHFYVSGENLGANNIRNSITILATGKKSPVANDRIKTDLDFCKNSLLITPYTDCKQNMSAKNVAASTRLGDYLFDIPENGVHSIIGYSAGSSSSTKTIVYDQDLYKNVVYVNGSSHNMWATSTIKEEDYSAFKDMNVTYMITNEGGWGPNGVNNPSSITSSIRSMIAGGVKGENISVVSNDSGIFKPAKLYSDNGINIVDGMDPSRINGKRTKYRGHDLGTWAILNDSGIIAYLSAL